MKIKLFKEKYAKKVNKIKVKNKKKTDYKWVITITITAFVVSILFSVLSEYIIPNTNLIIGILLVIIFIIIGVLFDIIGISVTAATEKPFHSMATKNIKGAKCAIRLIKNAEKVSSFCNDVVGDICGIISGSAGVIISITIATLGNYDTTITTFIVTAIIASLTIGGKALGKGIAVNKSDYILYKFAKILAIFDKK